MDGKEGNEFLSYLSIPVVNRKSSIYFEIIGSGFIFEKNKKILFLTTAHTFKNEDYIRPALLIDNQLIEIKSGIKYVKINHCDVDLAIIQLPLYLIENSNYYKFSKRIAGLSNLNIDLGNHYFMNGYLSSKCRFDIVKNGFSVTQDVREVFININEKINQSYEYPFYISDKDRNGNKIPKLNGMRGAPLLQVSKDKGIHEISIGGICLSFQYKKTEKQFYIYIYPSQLLNDILREYPC